MTDKGRWHKHRMVTVRNPRLWWVRWLRTPVYHNRNLTKVDTSPYPYCPCVKHCRCENPSTSSTNGDCWKATEHCWTVSRLSFLHRWTGLTLFYKTWKGAPDDDR